jgi:[acyl-carrier-protein] S-malonyltransferase
MQAAVPVGKGAMAAIIGLEADVLGTICKEAAGEGVCQIANDNGGGQLVISGSKAEVEAACAAASENGAKRAILLPVSAPFHSALMVPAADVMADALSKVEVKAPAVPVIANVLAAPASDPDEIRRLLVEQVTGRVRWRETVEWMAANGVTQSVEAGSGKVLTGLARRIAREISGVTVGTPEEVDAAIAAIG